MKYSKFKQSLIDQNLWNSDDEELVLPSSTVSSTVSSTNSLKECVICASEQNVNDFITCLYCNWTFCYSCCEQWLLSHVDFKCMNCKKLWSMQFLYENLNWSFYNGKFKHHKNNIIIQRELSFIPETMQYVETEMIKRKAEEYAKDIRHMYTFYNSKLGYTTKGEYKNFTHDDLKNSIIDNIKKLHELSPNKITDFHIDFLTEHGDPYNISKTTEQIKKIATPNIEIICKCKIENCKGLMKKLDRSIICMICSLTCCFYCEETLSDNHKCDKNNKESISEIRKTTKKCPNCHSQIYRTEGCSQMWCTNCNTSFDWNTGEKILGRIHNPHYFEYLSKLNKNDSREINRNENCVEDWMFNSRINNIINQLEIRNYKINIEELNGLFSKAYRLYLHIEQTELRNYSDHEYTPTSYRKYRLLYLLSDITDKQLNNRIIIKEKRREYLKETYDHLIALNNMLYEYCTIFINTSVTEEIKNKCTKQKIAWFNNLYVEYRKKLYELIKIFNENMNYIHNKYNYSSHIYAITDKDYWTIIHIDIRSAYLRQLF